MKLYDQFSQSGYHTSIGTTFGLDFDTYESIVLSRLRGSGCRNNLVIADHRMLAHALEGGSALPRMAGTHYSLCGAKAGGVFHPKVFLQLGRRGARMILGSANLTPAGLAGNLELASVIECGTDHSAERSLIAAVWTFVSSFIDQRQQSARDQTDWMLRRTAWLHDAIPAGGPVTLSDGTTAALLATGSTTGIGSQFSELVGESIHRLVVISPYWDRELAALSYLRYRLSPHETALLLDPSTGEFPKSAYTGIEGVSIYDGRGIFKKRFAHAKAIIAQGRNADHVLFGSANCTIAALGTDRFKGRNVEACLYRRLPPGAMIDHLRLDPILTTPNLLDAGSLRTDTEHDEVPLESLARSAPGHFEYQNGMLLWYPPNIENPYACEITLLDVHAELISGTLNPVSESSSDPIRYRVYDMDQPPRLVRVRFVDGTISARAVVSVVDTLRTDLRERHRQSLQNKIDQLESDTDANLALLDILSELESIETAGADTKVTRRPASTRTRDSSATDEEPHRFLTYDDFIAGRRPRTGRQESSFSSLAGSEISLVRGMLNRIIGLGSGSGTSESDSPDLDMFSLGDETDDPEGAIGSGRDFSDSGPSAPANSNREQRQPHATAQRRATQDELIKAATGFQKRIQERQSHDTGLTKYDLIRLRVLLMILVTAASPYSASRKFQEPQGQTIRVLPIDGSEKNWPRMIGRLLFGFFGGNNPAVLHLEAPAENEQVPCDFNECWATCYWCLQLLLQAPLSQESRIPIKRLFSLAEAMFRRTLPSEEELVSEDILYVMDRMSERYAAHLNLDPVAIREGHINLVRYLLSPPR